MTLPDDDDKVNTGGLVVVAVMMMMTSTEMLINSKINIIFKTNKILKIVLTFDIHIFHSLYIIFLPAKQFILKTNIDYILIA